MPRPPSSRAGDHVIASPPMHVRWIRSYQDWRDAVPFTDAEVVAALRDAAAVEVNEFMARKRLRAAEFLERTGKLSSGMLGLALPFLVRVCDIVGPEGALCGKPALYRYGSHGRCRAHKALIPEESRRAYLQRDQNAGAKNALYRDADREQDARRAFHAACGRRNRNVRRTK